MRNCHNAVRIGVKPLPDPHAFILWDYTTDRWSADWAFGQNVICTTNLSHPKTISLFTEPWRFSVQPGSMETNRIKSRTKNNSSGFLLRWSIWRYAAKNWKARNWSHPSVQCKHGILVYRTNIWVHWFQSQCSVLTASD